MAISQMAVYRVYLERAERTVGSSRGSPNQRERVDDGLDPLDL